MDDRLEQKMMRVQGAQKSALVERLRAREDDIITRLVQAYRAGKCDANMLYGGIATIAELRSIVTEAEHEKQAVDNAINQVVNRSHIS